MLWFLLACGPGPTLDQPNPAPDWPMYNVLESEAEPVPPKQVPKDPKPDIEAAEDTDDVPNPTAQ